MLTSADGQAEQSGTAVGGPITRVGVVVPAKNEQATLEACLDGLATAAAAIDVPVQVVVVLDDCSDRSADVVATFSGELAARGLTGRVRIDPIDVALSNVGAARAAGIASLIGDPAERLWLASTDADSVVPVDWLSGQLVLAHTGAAVVIGTVMVPDWQDRSAATAARAVRDYRVADRRAGRPHGHIHGANLGFSSAAYRAAGGFAALAAHEDVALVDAFHAAGMPVAWSLDLPVATSARRHARTPVGFASYLDTLEAGCA